MMKIISAISLWLLGVTVVFGQSLTPVLPYTGGQPVTGSNPLPVAGTFSASLSGFAPNGTYTNLTSNALSHSVALPVGTTSVVFNTGTTAVSCALSVGASSAVANENVIQPGSWLGFSVGSNNTLSCINQAGDSASNVVVASGGTGLPTGAGGGSSSGGSGSNASVGATGSSVPGSATYLGVSVAGNLTGLVGTANGLKVDGSAVTQPVSATSLPLPTGAATQTTLASILTALGSPFQAGGSIGNTTFAVTQATSSSLKAQVDPLTIATWGLMSGTVPGSAPTNTQIIGGIYNLAAPSPSTGQTLPFQLDSQGNLNVNIKAGAGAGGTAITDQASFTQGVTSETPIGCLFINSYSTISSGHAGVLSCTNVGSLHTTVDNANNNGRAAATSSSPVVSAPNLSTAGAIVPNNTTAVVVKGSAGVLFGVQLGGIGSGPAYLKIYNAATATCGSGTPVKRLIIPAASTAANGAGSNVTFGNGLNMSTGITYCVTTGIADNDTTAPVANNFLVNVDFE